MALAENGAQLRAMSTVFEGLRREHEALKAEIDAVTTAVALPRVDPEKEVEAALGLLESTGDLAADPDNLESIGELFRRLDVRLFLRFRQAAWGKRTGNRVAGGVVTFGAAEPPVALLRGAALASANASPDAALSVLPAVVQKSDASGAKLRIVTASFEGFSVAAGECRARVRSSSHTANAAVIVGGIGPQPRASRGA